MDQEDIDRAIELTWEDRTPFEANNVQCDLAEADVIALMRIEVVLTSCESGSTAG